MRTNVGSGPPGWRLISQNRNPCFTEIFEKKRKIRNRRGPPRTKHSAQRSVSQSVMFCLAPSFSHTHTRTHAGVVDSCLPIRIRNVSQLPSVCGNLFRSSQVGIHMDRRSDDPIDRREIGPRVRDERLLVARHAGSQLNVNGDGRRGNRRNSPTLELCLFEYDPREKKSL